MKKVHLILPLALILCFTVGCQDKEAMEELETAADNEVDLKAEEVALRQFIEEVEVAYKNRDSKAMADMCDETIMTFGIIQKGRENIEKFWAYYLGSLGNTQINHLKEICLEFVTSEVAIHQTLLEFSNRPPDKDEKPQPPQQNFAAMIYVKRDGQWLRKGGFLLPITQTLASEKKEAP